ncbi:MAG TPA: GFA family protein [Aestuariivirgaceae bacterium]|jgi:hypothetical protein
MTELHEGSCLCGAVRYEVKGPLREVVGCHCTQCRKQTGHFMAATAAKLAHFKVSKDAGLRWYKSSDRAKRGFCQICGSTLFWQGTGRDYIAIAAGTLDGATGITIAGHIFCADKGDYYEILDGEYQERGSTMTAKVTPGQP